MGGNFDNYNLIYHYLFRRRSLWIFASVIFEPRGLTFEAFFPRGVSFNPLSVNDVSRLPKFSAQNSALTGYARIFQI